MAETGTDRKDAGNTEPSRLSRGLELVTLLALLGVVAVMAAGPISCTDFFWHLELGELMLSTGSIPRVDTFSAVHPEAPYVQPQWLWELMAAVVQRSAGLTGIRVLQAVLLSGTFVLLFVLARRLLKNGQLALLVCATALLGFMDRFRARPDALTLGFVAASLPLLVQPHAGSFRARALAVFALALVWGNMHGGTALLLLLSFGALLVGTLLRHRLVPPHPAELTRLGTYFGLSLLGLALSPTLLPGLIHWVTLIGPQIETGNEEWLPTYTILRHDVTPVTVLVAALPTLVLLLYVWEQVRYVRRGGTALSRIDEWLLCGGYLVLSQHAIRNVVLCVVPLVFVLRARSESPTFARGKPWPTLLAALFLVLVVDDVFVRSYGGVARARALMDEDLLPGAYPEEAGAFLNEARLEGGIFNEGSWGGYLIWRTFPSAHVFVDTRQNLTPDMWRVFLASRSAVRRTPALEYAYERWGLELAVFRAPTFPLLEPPPDWTLLFRAGDQEVYQRRGGRNEASNLARTERYLRARGGSTAALDELAVRVGAERWLSRPEQTRSAERAQALIRAQSAVERAEGERELAGLYYRAGLYRSASEHYTRAEAFGVLDVPDLYFAAMSAHGARDQTRARARVRALELQGHLDRLSKRQRERFELLRAALDR